MSFGGILYLLYQLLSANGMPDINTGIDKCQAGHGNKTWWKGCEKYLPLVVADEILAFI